MEVGLWVLSAAVVFLGLCVAAAGRAIAASIDRHAAELHEPDRRERAAQWRSTSTAGSVRS